VNNTNARLVALADLFQDRLTEAKNNFDTLAASKGYLGIEASHMFHGPGACEQIAASKDVDAVIIATPSYFHPEHLEGVVAAGKHVYCEKPAGIDVPGAKRYLETGKKAQGKLSLAVGLQLRHAPPFAELIQHIHGGALGEMVCAQGYYYARPLSLPSWANASEAELKIRHFFYWVELSGGVLVDQSIHTLDIINWALQSHPVRATGAGGRKARQDEGNCWDHYNLTFTYPNAVHLTYSSTQFDKGWWDVCVRFFGNKGVGEAHYTGPVAIYGDEPWQAGTTKGPAEPSISEAVLSNLKDADPEKDKAFIDSIVNGHYLNEAATGVEATLTTILGRMAAFTGREVTWDEMLRSDQVLDPKIDINRFA
jgi:myo-inositol 2-dehydrogenase / D-chiro-inositol 1-dehydrogenase